MKWAKRVQKYVNFDTTADAAESGLFDIVQAKLDGWWACAVIKQGTASIYSRQGALKATLDADGVPPSILIGEYIVGTQRSVNSAEEGMLSVFDAIEIHGELWNMSYRYRMKQFQRKVEGKAPWLAAVGSIPVARHKLAWASLVEQGGAEGLVFRNTLHTYERGVIGRVKKTVTMDYVVMDVLPGEGKHKGRMGAVVCGLYEGGKLIEKVRVGGGWTDVEREAIWKRPRHFIGRVLEVRGWQLFASGALRHPNAVGFRDDKKAKECVFVSAKGVR
jgi:ATP-dependent DNA ligase